MYEKAGKRFAGGKPTKLTFRVFLFNRDPTMTKISRGQATN